MLNNTVLSEAVVLNPNPAITMELAFATNGSLLRLTDGITVATCVLTLCREFVVTLAFRVPTAEELVVNVTLKAVAVAEVTVPTALLLNDTVFSEALVLNPKPLIISVVVSAANELVLLVITGMTLAT